MKQSQIKSNETCISLGLSRKLTCSSCLSLNPLNCEKAWVSDCTCSSNYEDDQAYIDVWSFLITCKGFSKPYQYRRLSYQKKWKPYIESLEQLYKNFTPSPYKHPSSKNPTSTPRREPSSQRSKCVSTTSKIASAIKVAIQTPFQRLKAIVTNPKSDFSSQSTPEPASPTIANNSSPTAVSAKKRLTYEDQPHPSELGYSSSPLRYEENSSNKKEHPPANELLMKNYTFENNLAVQYAPPLEVPTLLPQGKTSYFSDLQLKMPDSLLPHKIEGHPSFFSASREPPIHEPTIPPPEIGQGSSRFQIINELGIKTNVMDSSDKEQVKDLLSDIVDLCRIHQLSLDFTHKGNNRAARLIPIASCQDKKLFKTTTQRQLDRQCTELHHLKQHHITK